MENLTGRFVNCSEWMCISCLQVLTSFPSSPHYLPIPTSPSTPFAHPYSPLASTGLYSLLHPLADLCPCPFAPLVAPPPSPTRPHTPPSPLPLHTLPLPRPFPLPRPAPRPPLVTPVPNAHPLDSPHPHHTHKSSALLPNYTSHGANRDTT